MFVRLFAVILTVLIAGSSAARAEGPHWPDHTTLQTQMFFGLYNKDGSGVTERDWNDFLANEIAPRFPDGFTVMSGFGQGAGGPPAGIVASNTNLLIVVHRNSNELQLLFDEIEASYKELFGEVGVFRVDFPVRIAD